MTAKEKVLIVYPGATCSCLETGLYRVRSGNAWLGRAGCTRSDAWRSAASVLPTTETEQSP